MPFGIFASVGINIGLSLLGAAVSGRKRKRRRRFVDDIKPFGEVKYEPRGPQFLWGEHKRFHPAVTYLSTTYWTRHNDAGSSSVSGKHLNMVLRVSRGACHRLIGIWINGVYETIHWRGADDGEGREADVSHDGYIREYFRADGSQGAALRAETRNIQPEQAHLRWTTSDRMDGYSWVYLRFSANPRDDTGEPESTLESMPRIDLHLEGRLVRIPNSDKSSTWSRGYTNESSAVLYDILNIAGLSDRVDDASFHDSHRVGNQTVRVTYPLADGTERAFYAASDAPPAKPKSFDPPSRIWRDRRPPLDGRTWWRCIRKGTRSRYEWGDVTFFHEDSGDDGDTPRHPAERMRTSDARDGYEGDPYSDVPPIRLPHRGDVREAPVKIPPDSPALPGDYERDGGEYRRKAQEEGVAHKRYPCSVDVTGEELGPRDLPEVISRLMLSCQGDLYQHRGRLILRVGYAAEPIGSMRDGVDCEITRFQSSAPDDQQWNTYRMTITGSDGSDTEIIDVQDAARRDAYGGTVPIDFQFPYIATPLHARRMLMITAMRQRYQRQGEAVVPPDANYAWLPRLEPGARLRLRSDDQELTSFELDRNGRLTTQPDTMVRVLDVLENPDRSLTFKWIEDPDIIWRDWIALPNLDPDVSDGRFSVLRPQGLILDEHFRAQPTGNILYMSAAYDPAPEPVVEVRWRPVPPADRPVREETSAGLVKRGSGWLYKRAANTGYPIDFGFGTTYYGILHEVDVRLISSHGARSAWTRGTITPSGSRLSPDRARGVAVRNFGNGLGVLIDWVIPPEPDYLYTIVRYTRDAENLRNGYNDQSLTELRTTENRFQWLFGSVLDNPRQHRVYIVHRNQHTNDSPVFSIDFYPSVPGSTEGGGHIGLYDIAFAKVSGTSKPHRLPATAETDAELAAHSSRASRFPWQPTASETVWSCVRPVTQNPTADFGDEAFGIWQDWVIWSIGSSVSPSSVNDYTIFKDVEGRYLNRIGGEEVGTVAGRWDGSTTNRQAFIDGLSTSQPVIELRRRDIERGFSPPEWSPIFKHRWVRMAILTPDGTILGHVANLTTDVDRTAASDDGGGGGGGGTQPDPQPDPAPPPAPVKTRRWFAINDNESTPPAVGSTYNLSSPWSLTDPRPISAGSTKKVLWSVQQSYRSTSDFKYETPPTRLTVVNATGTGRRSTEYAYRESTSATAPSKPPSSTAIGETPAGYTSLPADPYPSRSWEFRYQRTVIGTRAYSWRSGALWARRLSRTIFARGRDLSTPLPLGGGSRTAVPRQPVGWQSRASTTRPTASAPTQWQAEVIGNGARATVSTPRVVAAWDHGTDFWIETATEPDAPTEWNPAGWSRSPLTANPGTNVYKTTRNGWSTVSIGSDGQPTSSSVSFTTPERVSDTRTAQTVYCLGLDGQNPSTPTNTGTERDLTSPASACSPWSPVLATVLAGVSSSCPIVYAISRGVDTDNQYRRWGVGSGRGLRRLYKFESRAVYSDEPTDIDRVPLPPTGTADATGQRVRTQTTSGAGRRTLSDVWYRPSSRTSLWRSTQTRVRRISNGTGTWSSWKTPTLFGTRQPEPPKPIRPRPPV